MLLKNKKFLSVSLFLMLTNVCALTHADELKNLLKAADHFRLGEESMQVETLITTFSHDGNKEKERAYLVYNRPNRQSLVLMQSPAEKGQKVLMSGDDFWMLLPGSQRPMRITPMQKLLGDASIGDIATTAWEQDYEGKIIGEEQCDGRFCLHLSLNATRKSVAYQHIELWLGKTLHEPLKADLYVQSEKLAKQASFVFDKPQAPTAVSQMILLDQLSSHKETRVQYLGRKPKSIPDQWLNPMFLAKNPNLE